MKRNSEIKELFLKHFDKPTTELKFSNLYELLVCVMLSAQCTDKRVNLITPELFKAYPDITSLANANLSSLKTYIQSCSFYNNKAQNLIKMAQSVRENFNAEIPLDEEKLKSLAGVGQKTAHVVLIEWCGANCMAVDTHVFRVSHRLGLSKAKTPEATEEDLTRIFKDNLNYLHQAMVLFGRYTCKAKKPLCKECFLNHLCKSKDKELE
ncbi:endonuclease III [Campylobacter coli]|uniref:Endonuclease III n=4 Tax=Campylobacter coli TaxID=195 RepID=A0A0Q2HCD2_CAMCO|nr:MULTISPECIES: endonuclease III [Campylobacter]EAK3886941.1 endonuclease III [Campylobacter hyointestinalis]EAK5659651.1 endonuclease III [Campylobacter fetus]EIA56940.1 endonuclease III [Campylobacter coli 2692]EIA58255.1 endonuclease III [Campylobacter coli 2698]EIA72167.1 endonuclease III [Campylobacter coli 7--1]EIA75388.1 endonuclease III [Campylobacter coli 1891]EIA76578.1 endonuclease III [Campylobacter coli 132-6]EIA85948.1 endonuclease III [Campylobacter coli 67-8]EIB06994.1 end